MRIMHQKEENSDLKRRLESLKTSIALSREPIERERRTEQEKLQKETLSLGQLNQVRPGTKGSILRFKFAT